MLRRNRIYLDTAAATPLDRRVRAAMAPYLAREFGNPSSLHQEGVAAATAVAAARERVAQTIGAHADEIIFTSGGTEANNLAVFGCGGSVITTTIEHSSVRAAAQALGREGVPVIFLNVDEEGRVDPERLREALQAQPTTRLVSIIYAHNEIGTIQNVKGLAKVIRDFRKARHQEPGVGNFPYFHLDACQAPRFLEVNVARLGVDLLTLNSGKIYGPKGVGCLYVRRGVKLEPRSWGGGQEAGRRPGTENVAGIAGFAKALELAAAERVAESARLTTLRDRLIAGLAALPDSQLNGPTGADRLPNNVNLSFSGIEAEQAVIELDARGLAVSSGSACASSRHEASYVILALGRSREAAASSIRFSLGRETTGRDIDRTIAAVSAVITKLRTNLLYARNPLA